MHPDCDCEDCRLARIDSTPSLRDKARRAALDLLARLVLRRDRVEPSPVTIAVARLRREN